MEDWKKLEQIFSHFPGIGPRQAKRFVYHILGSNETNIHELTSLINTIRKKTDHCIQCKRIYIKNESPDLSNKSNICRICRDETRDRSILMLVARDSDLENIEKSGAYDGLYFVLGGLVPVLEEDYERYIKLSDLIKRLKQSNEIKDIIFSLSLNRDGENTENIIRNTLAEYSLPINIYEMGRGLSTGSEIEYVDSGTIKSALLGRFKK